MLRCSDMKVGQIYYCSDCGLEIRVVKECTSCAAEDSTCSEETCTFSCCDSELKLKK
jgi:hypothetical protein